MLVPVRCPDFGESQAKVGVWMAGVGMPVVRGEPLVDVVLPGLCWSVAAPVDGRIREIRSQNRALVTAGEILGWLECDTEAS